MAKRYGDLVACDGMPRGGAEVGAAEVFVEISPAYTDKCRGNLGKAKCVSVSSLNPKRNVTVPTSSPRGVDAGRTMYLGYTGEISL